MGRIKRIIGVTLLALFSGVIVAQNNTNSPYSRYGYGHLVDQGFGRNQAMGGVGFALRDNSQINPLNPAAYTAMDSLTFLFEGGISLQNTNFSEGSQKVNAKNSSLEYIAMQFRLKKWISMSIGLLPISNIGYSVNDIVVDEDNKDANHVIIRSGNGGLHKVYAGWGIIPMKNLSVGLNVGFFWGDLDRNTTLYFPNVTQPNGSGSLQQNRLTNVDLKGVALDFGIQYDYKLSNSKSLLIGATYSPKTKLSNKITRTYVQDQIITDTKRTESSYDVAAKYGFGVAYQVDKKLLLSGDILYQRWSKAKYNDETNGLCDLLRIGVGAEILPNYYSRNLFAKMKYRLGAYYSNPYYKVDGVRATREYGVSAGFGIPLPQGKSLLNISAQFVQVKGRRSNFLDETMIRLNIGLVFNERWFFKRKI